MRLQINIATCIGLSIPLLLFVNDQRGLLHTHESLGGWTANTNSSSSSSSSTSSSSRITNQRVTCDSDPCEGEFKYDGPATDPIQAVELYHQALEKYSYGGQRGIYIPDHSNGIAGCIKDWEDNKDRYRDRGMSANREDITIFNAFFNQPEFWTSNHTYMEIGAHDGLRESNSRFYDMCLRWQGLLVEAHPLNYERTVIHRPNAHHINVAPSCTKDDTGTISFTRHTFTNAQVLSKGKAGIKVHCGPLQHYLDALGIKHIDFWSLDVEGSEFNILKTVDFDRTQIDIVIVESQNNMSGNPEYQKKVAYVRSHMLQNGYLMLGSVKVYKSDVFLHTRACHRYDFPECKRHENEAAV